MKKLTRSGKIRSRYIGIKGGIQRTAMTCLLNPFFMYKERYKNRNDHLSQEQLISMLNPMDDMARARAMQDSIAKKAFETIVDSSGLPKKLFGGEA
jgi:hypothetical protein